MWKAFQELQALGWLDSPRMPRMYSVQSAGCAPIVTAFNNRQRFAEPFANAATIASGLRVPVAVGDFMILDGSILHWTQKACRAEGIAICPETACCFAALEQLKSRGQIRSTEQVVVFNTGAAQKYVEVIRENLPNFDGTQPIRWNQLQGV
jgi:threonine synthase